MFRPDWARHSAILPCLGSVVECVSTFPCKKSHDGLFLYCGAAFVSLACVRISVWRLRREMRILDSGS